MQGRGQEHTGHQVHNNTVGETWNLEVTSNNTVGGTLNLEATRLHGGVGEGEAEEMRVCVRGGGEQCGRRCPAHQLNTRVGIPIWGCRFLTKWMQKVCTNQMEPTFRTVTTPVATSCLRPRIPE
jgi:hypothetical protein